MVEASPNEGKVRGNAASAGGQAGAPAASAVAVVPVADPDRDAAPAEHGAGTGA